MRYFRKIIYSQVIERCLYHLTVLVKFPPLFGNHQLGQETGDSEVPARGHKLLETGQTAGSNQVCYMSENPTKSLDINNCQHIRVTLYLINYLLLFKTNHSVLMDKS